MAEETYNIEFDGYWREPNIDDIPKESGVYCVYECTHNKEEKTVTIHKLIYIGESINVNERIANHEKWDKWKNAINSGHVICISFAEVNDKVRERVEAALIYKHKPPVNTECVDNFNYDKTTINSSGKNSKLISNFTVS